MDPPPLYDPPPYDACWVTPGAGTSEGTPGSNLTQKPETGAEERKPLTPTKYDTCGNSIPVVPPCVPLLSDISEPGPHALVQYQPQSQPQPTVPQSAYRHPDRRSTYQNDVRVDILDPGAYNMDRIVWGPWEDMQDAEVNKTLNRINYTSFTIF